MEPNTGDRVVIPMGNKTRSGGRARRVATVDSRAVIHLRTGHIYAAADEACSVLANDCGYYSRGELLVRYCPGTGPSVFERKVDSDGIMRSAGPMLVPATHAGIQDDLERKAVFVRMLTADPASEQRDKVEGCPKPLPAVILSREGRRNQFKQVRGLSSVPVVHPDGPVIYDGYCPRAGVVVAVPRGWPELDLEPSLSAAKAALQPIRELLQGFPFRTDLDFAVTVAAMLTAVIGPTLKARPAFGWSATAPGSGKSKLADVVAIIGSGRPAAAVTWADREEESEKRLGSALLAGDPFILLDNIERPLKSQMLNSAITQESVAIRLLGRSHMPRVESCATFLATGNNLIIAGDLTRRFMVAELDSGVERPELRSFDFDPVEMAIARRVDLVNSLLTIALYGRSVQVHAAPLGSFEDWSYRVRDPLVQLGLADPVGVLARLHRDDPAREAAAYLVTQWHRAFKAPTSTDQAIRFADSSDASLRDALDNACGQAGGINKKRLGHYLRGITGRVFGGLRMASQHDPIGNRQLWFVEAAGGAGQSSKAGARAAAGEDYL